MKINWADHQVLPAEGIALSRRLALGQEISCLQVVAAHSGRLNLTPHWHSNEQWVIVTSGSVSFVCDDNEYELFAGDIAYIPIGQPHTATTVGEAGATLLELSAPPRLDLVPGSLVPSSMRSR
ncbi:cupin domain-containing protein [Frankia sp. AgKG'84/4]|uniref:cupin domain-containing protein n=1 Tax=Frankia sp. AgKG'84/4 TaxID=573490 RepID=UPI00200C6A84|nr:cupin domain-containing protein [Frankia sp. AgKG'84/4]MCL9793440.1 cupin domain-containing protein [Frankia sp. AgKG'84/4]